MGNRKGSYMFVRDLSGRCDRNSSHSCWRYSSEFAAVNKGSYNSLVLAYSPQLYLL